MISRSKSLRRYCSEDISRIENYDKAVNDKEHMWECHHRAEILPCGRYSQEELKKVGMFWHRPASELIFLRHDEHKKLHNNREVVMRRLSDGFTQTFPSQRDAVVWLRNNGYPKAEHGTISKVCSGRGDKKRKTIYGATWRRV